VRYEWDERKNALNLRKHGIRFETAVQVFDDPNCLIEQSYDDPGTGELRWTAIGVAPTYGLELVVIHVYRYYYETTPGQGPEEVIRIVSARRANSSESRRSQGL